MSNFIRAAYHPLSRTVKAAEWLDNYFGQHKYGVRFADDNWVYTPEEVTIPTDVEFVPKEVL